MVVGDKPPKNKGVASGSNGGDIDQFDPMYLHSNDTNDVFLGQVFSKNAKNYDSLVNLPDCTCANSDKLKEHNQLLKLMQFLMGLNEVYASIRSIILTTDLIPDVRGALLPYLEMSLIGVPSLILCLRLEMVILLLWLGLITGCFELIGYPHNFKKNIGPNKSSASNNVVSGNKDQSHTFTDDQYKRLMSLISEKYGSSSITANIAVYLGYQVSLLYVYSLSKDNKFRVIFDEDTCVIQDSFLRTQVGTDKESNGLYFLNTSKKLVNNNIQVCCLSKCIWHNKPGHPSDQVLDILRHKLNLETNTKINLCEVCYKAKQTREPFPISEHKTKSLGDLVHLDVWGPYKVQSREGYKYFLTIVDDYTSDRGEDLSSEPYDDRRDNNYGNSKGTNQLSHGGTENTGNANKDDEGLPNDNIPEAAICEDLESEILEDNSLSADRQMENLRRSTRKTSMPAKLSDFEVNTKVKYNIDRQVNYSKLSIENYNFSTSLNKISEPKTYSKAAKDIRWIEAVNQEMEALNRNGTWIIVDLPVGRKPIGGKWVYKVKY
nr:ribonuclease H-like domain-containing protein [Tanacetum cinerariifolium]